jgi:prepilin-type processing-associated H-X9-DG protein
MTFYAPASFRIAGGAGNMVWGKRGYTTSTAGQVVPPMAINGQGVTLQLTKTSKMKGGETVMMAEEIPPTDPWSGAHTASLGGEPQGSSDFYEWIRTLYGPWAHDRKSANYLFLDGHVESILAPVTYSATPDWFAIYSLNSGKFSRMFSVDKSLLPLDPGNPG